MSNSNVKTLKAFTVRDADTGALQSYAYGSIYVVDSTVASAWISAGLAEAYTGAVAIPTGTKSITENGSGIDVEAYKTANVNVPNPSTGTLAVTQNGEANVTDYAKVSVNVPVVTLTYNANGGTGSVDPVHVGKNTAVELSDGTGLTAPTDKEFAGWATTDSAEEPDVESPLTVTANTTLYAVYVDEAES